jgi:PAS domain S-box-containing protein
MNDNLGSIIETLLRLSSENEPEVPTDKVQKLLRELRDYIIELENRNEYLKLAQQELQIQKQLQECTFDAIQDAVFVVDPHTRTITMCNKSVESVFGYTIEEVIGRNTEFLHVDNSMYKRFGHELFPVLDKYGIFHTQFEMKRKDGSVFISEHTVTEIRNEQGERIGVVSVVRDITENVQAQEALHENDQRFKVALKNSQIIVAGTDTDLRYTWIYNPHHNFLPDAVIGKRDTEITHNAGTEKLEQLKQRVLDSGIAAREEIAFPVSDGMRTYDISAEPLFDKDGKLLGVTTAALDVTDRKKAEAIVKNLASFPRDNPNPVLEVTPSGEITYANPATEEMLRHSGLNDAVCFLPPNWGEIVETLRERPDMPLWQQVVVVESLFEERICQVTDSAAIRIYARDITAQAKARQKLQDSREMMRELARRVQTAREEERTRLAREFHDVLTQDLTRLKIDLVWLHRKLSTQAEMDTPVILTSRIAELEQLTDDVIKNVQRIATGLRPAVLDSLGLAAAVEWQAESFRNKFGIHCHVEVPDHDLFIGNDTATVVFRILQESLTNVQRHAGATAVAVVLHTESGQLILNVHDNGVGIDDEVLSNPLSIGLLGMKERAELLGGICEICSKPGMGTTVEVRLPVETQ